MFIKGMLTEADLMIFNATSCYDLSQTSSGFEFSSTIVLVLYTNWLNCACHTITPFHCFTSLANDTWIIWAKYFDVIVKHFPESH